MAKKQSPPLSVRVPTSHRARFDALALEHGGRGKAICWLIDQLYALRPQDPAPAQVQKTAPLPAPSTSLPLPAGIGGRRPAAPPAPCPKCEGPTKRLAAPGTVECYRCGYRGGATA